VQSYVSISNSFLFQQLKSHSFLTYYLSWLNTVPEFKQINNQMQQFSSLLSWRLFTAQHVLGILPPIIRSSMTAVAVSGFTFVSWWVALCSWSGQSAQPRTRHDCHHDMKVRPEAATAVTELLMMGGKTPETCWAVNKRRHNKLKNCCIRLVIYLN
jgi:hypothetical protein